MILDKTQNLKDIDGSWVVSLPHIYQFKTEMETKFLIEQNVSFKTTARGYL